MTKIQLVKIVESQEFHFSKALMLAAEATFRGVSVDQAELFSSFVRALASEFPREIEVPDALVTKYS
jgi:hypothetical protein